MRFALFYHSLRSCWNHGNAHFLRGFATELIAQGHDVRVFEPADSWSVTNLAAEYGTDAACRYREAYPQLWSESYTLSALDLDKTLHDVDVVIVHEWNEPELVSRIGRARRHAPFTLLFHDTHHRSVTAPAEIGRYDLVDYDAVLAFGETVRQVYLRERCANRVFVWHEAADTRIFRPLTNIAPEADLVWVGNWGDDERAEEIRTFLIDPVRTLGWTANVYGVRYPEHASAELRAAGIDYRGWLPNHLVPNVFARHRATVHIPRRPYATSLPGVPTIRMFEALACGIPLVSAPWDDTENLFRPGVDYLVARNSSEMTMHLRTIKQDKALADSLIRHGLETIQQRHTCTHRVAELISICKELSSPGMPEAA